MRRRRLLALVGSGAALAARRAAAQQAARLIGLLRGAEPDNDFAVRTIAARLRELGFEDGRDVAFTIRAAEGRTQAAPALAAELARLRPAVVVAFGDANTEAARMAMPETPIVSVSGDVVGAGFAQSVARPGGTVTGVSMIAEDLNAKRLEILAQLVPRGATVLILVDPAGASGLPGLRSAAQALDLAVTVAVTAGLEQIEGALEGARAAGASGIGVSHSVLFFAHRRRIVELAMALRLPAVLHWADIARDGAVAAYGPSLGEVFRQAGGLVARILRGERPAEIPIERPTRIVLAVNVRTARTIGLEMPPALLARADEVIE